MPLHRLIPPTYLGGVPGTHDEINNATSGIPALADTVKVGSNPNAGTYFIAFGEDGTSSNGNRPHTALAENTDYLDDVVNIEVPVVAHIDGASGAGLASLVLTGDVFVGKSGTANSQDERDRLIKVVDSVTGNDVIDSSGDTVKASLIHNGAATNQVGVPATGFFAGPTVNFTPNIPASTSYRVFYGIRSSYRDISRDKIRLDAFTRQVIRGAHQVPGESLRFIREAGRRALGSGGPVTALAATIVETPGLGENLLPKANAMFMDVDPDATVGTGGTWSVRFDRTSTPKVMLRINEGTGGDSAWENVFERVSFLDPNHIASGFTPASIDLTETNVEAATISILGQDPGAESVSICRRLNARRTVVCGVNRGDFTGVTSIEDAIDYAIAEGITDLVIELTEESVFTMVNKTVALNLTIIGVESQSQITTDSSTLSAMAVSAGFELTLKNISFQNGGGLAEYAFTAAANASVRCEDCTFENRIILSESKGTRAYAAFFKRCVFTPDFAVAGDHGSVELQTAGDADTYLFEDCTFVTAQRVAALKLEPGSPGSPSVVRNIRFVRCFMELHAPSVTGGNPDYNSGPIFMEAGGSTNLEYQDITFEDCHVTANTLSVASRHAMLLDFRCGKVVRNFGILGGRWEINPVDSLISPFFLGDTTAFPTTSKLRNVRIENLEWGFTGAVSTSYGDAATALAFSGTVAEWAAFVIQADDKLTMKNVKFITCTVESDSGDLYCVEPQEWDFDGVELRTFVDTASSATPNFRVKLQSAFSEHAGVVEGLVISPVSVVAGVAVNNGLVEIIPGGRLRGRNWLIANFSDSAANGIYLPEPPVANLHSNGFHLEHSQIRSLGGDGFNYIETGIAATAVGDNQFEECTFFACAIGIHIGHTGGAQGIGIGWRIQDCVVSSCATTGVVFEPVAVNAQGGFLITANHINTNPSISAVQMRFGSPSNQIGETFEGVMYGNDFGGSSGAEGQVEFNVSGVSDPVDFWGTNTGLGTSASPPGGGYPHSEKVWTSGAQMLHNRARYLET